MACSSICSGITECIGSSRRLVSSLLIPCCEGPLLTTDRGPAAASQAVAIPDRALPQELELQQLQHQVEGARQTSRALAARRLLQLLQLLTSLLPLPLLPKWRGTTWRTRPTFTTSFTSHAL